jgi:hypothetical protein
VFSFSLVTCEKGELEMAFQLKPLRWRKPGITVCASALCFAAAMQCLAAENEAGKQFLLAKEPEGAVDVLALRKEAKDQQDVVVVGRIGGRSNPWIKGMAVFPIVDRSLKPCNEIEGDTCKTPWDFCCEPNLAKATVLVMFNDASGKVIKKDPRELLHVKELQTVVITGKAKRDKSGNVTVMASKLHVRPDEKATE